MGLPPSCEVASGFTIFGDREVPSLAQPLGAFFLRAGLDQTQV